MRCNPGGGANALPPQPGASRVHSLSLESTFLSRSMRAWAVAVALLASIFTPLLLRGDRTFGYMLAVPDYLHLSAGDYVHHVGNLLPTASSPLESSAASALLPPEKAAELGSRRLLGYSCRTIFDALLPMLIAHNPDLVVAVSPFHHTSFIKILERHVRAENIVALESDRALTTLRLPSQANRPIGLVVVTHVFGRDFDLSAIADAKNGEGEGSTAGGSFLLVEDRCQGGSLRKPFSHEAVDVALYSMGMDKRPIALGGGYANVRDLSSSLAFPLARGTSAGGGGGGGSADFALARSLSAELDALPVESTAQRAWALLLKTPTYAIYNLRAVQRLVVSGLYAGQQLGVLPTLASFAVSYRKANPGFEHAGYMKRPSTAARRSMLWQLDNWLPIEREVGWRWQAFVAALGEDAAAELLPWAHQDSLSIYNAIWVTPARRQALIAFAEAHGVISMSNPTYKAIAVPADGWVQQLMAGIVYLPCLSGLQGGQKEIDALAAILKEWVAGER